MSPGSPEGGGTESGSGGGLAGTLRTVARGIRWLPDRLLHPRRRRRARERLSRRELLDGPVLFVCHGNICRSPYAEKVLEREARGRLDASSVGLMGPDRPAPETAREVAAERGVDLRDHRSRLVSSDLLRAAGSVVVMDPRQSRALRDRYGFGRALVLGDLDPETIRRRPIRDPVFQPPEVFHEVYGRIDRCVEGMLEAMGLPVAGGRGKPDGDREARHA